MGESRAAPQGDLKLVVAGLSDVGCVRQNNEDSYGVFDCDDRSKGCLLIIADGMGGAAGGEVASRLAVDSVWEAYCRAPGDQPRGEALRDAIEQANQIIYERASGDPRLGGMGTTCTAALIIERQLIIGHVGDSRAYVVRDGVLTQITRDHSLAAELERRVRPGEPVPEAGRHVLTRCLGVCDDVSVDLTPFEFEEEQALVLCSDGLPSVVGPQEILQAVTSNPPEQACRQLIELGCQRGAPDNITVQIAQYVKS